MNKHEHHPLYICPKCGHIQISSGRAKVMYYDEKTLGLLLRYAPVMTVVISVIAGISSDIHWWWIIGLNIFGAFLFFLYYIMYWHQLHYTPNRCAVKQCNGSNLVLLDSPDGQTVKERFFGANQFNESTSAL